MYPLDQIEPAGVWRQWQTWRRPRGRYSIPLLTGRPQSSPSQGASSVPAAWRAAGPGVALTRSPPTSQCNKTCDLIRRVITRAAITSTGLERHVVDPLVLLLTQASTLLDVFTWVLLLNWNDRRREKCWVSCKHSVLQTGTLLDVVVGVEQKKPADTVLQSWLIKWCLCVLANWVWLTQEGGLTHVLSQNPDVHCLASGKKVKTFYSQQQLIWS